MMGDKGSVDSLLECPDFERLLGDYRVFTQSTLDGQLGKTARFCMEYVERVNLFHILDRSVRECNVDLYLYALTEATDLFFATNRHSYARWMAKHQLNLINLPTTHPGLKELLTGGLFSIRRTNNHFSRLPVDLTLEQTVNADAASRMTGYTAATNNYSARLRWSVTKGSRAAVISAALDLAGMQADSGSQAELSSSRICRDNGDLKKVMDVILASADPFNMESELLVNIHTGKSATSEVTDSLLSIKQVGRERHDAFIQECGADPGRFEKPIPRNKLKTFVDQGARNRRSPNPVVKELRCTRNMFGRIAVIAAKRTVDLEFLLTYPLTSVPLSICRPDGTMAHTDKSALFSLLEEKVEEHGNPKKVSSHLIDGNFLLHCLPPNLPPTYGGLSREVLHFILAYPSERVDIVFDTYEEPSIKDCERDRRGAEETVYLIHGPEQVRPKDFGKALKSSSFKQQLPRFLMKDWAEQHHAPALTDREVFLGVEGECAKFSVVDNRVYKQPIDRLACNHPEADTRLCLHMLDVDDVLPGGDIVVRASDTDILVILLHHSPRVNSNLWMEVGTAGLGNRRYVNVSAIATEIGPEYCSALPGFHAYTGCDYTAAFVRKGKKRPFALLGQDDRYFEAFSAVATKPVDDATREVIKDYTCALYGARKIVPLNKHRFRVFEKAFGPKDEARPLHRLKGIDASDIPPYEAVVEQKVLRTNFVARMWNAACNNRIPKQPDFGWEMSNESYRVVWFDGPQMPESVVPEAGPNGNDEENDEEDSSTDKSDDGDDGSDNGFE